MKNSSKVIIALLGFLALITLFFQQKDSSEKVQKSNERRSHIANHTTTSKNLRAHLIELKSALVKRDRESIKSFFRFPINCAHNEIWYHVKADASSLTEHSRSFNEADFDTYFDQLFPQEFTEKCSELNVDSLLSTSAFHTVPFTFEGFSCQLNFDLSSTELSVNWYSEVKSKENPDMPYEYSVIYYFGIDENDVITFKEIRLAG